MTVNVSDLLSIIFTAISTAIGVSFPFLPASLPNPLSLPLLAGMAVLLTSIAGLLQVLSTDGDNKLNKLSDKSEEVVMPEETYQQELERAYEAGVNEGLMKNESHKIEPFSVEKDKSSESKLSELEGRLASIERQIDDLDRNHSKKPIEDIDSRLGTLEEDVDRIQGDYVGNFELNDRIGEIEDRIESQRNYIRTVYMLIKKNVEEFEPPDQTENRSEQAGNGEVELEKEE